MVTDNRDTNTNGKSNNFGLNNNIQDTDWFSITQRVRRYNRQLVGRVMELEKTLEEMQQKYGSVRDKSQQQELIPSQEQINNLAHKLRQSDQIIQQQKLSLQTLSDQLKASQAQVAKLERDCALLQGNYNQKNNQLVKLQSQIQELNARLSRQQRYNLQLRAALEKGSENTSPPETLASATQSIQPWSGETADVVEGPSQPAPKAPELAKTEQKKDPLPERIIPKVTETNIQDQSNLGQERRIRKQHYVELPSFLKSDPEES
jgi:chromosome segregation ATPase